MPGVLRYPAFRVVVEQKVTQLQQKHNELVETVEELETKLQTYSDKVDNLETRVQALENSSQS